LQHQLEQWRSFAVNLQNMAEDAGVPFVRNGANQVIGINVNNAKQAAVEPVLRELNAYKAAVAYDNLHLSIEAGEARLRSGLAPAPVV